ncbi:hypothetical protein C8R44DRAFT_869130 [Mycena epipterygia]|nr:hypothetical protein C8R44DRAFT_869130 [Mycena epipterygia]
MADVVPLLQRAPSPTPRPHCESVRCGKEGERVPLVPMPPARLGWSRIAAAPRAALHICGARPAIGLVGALLLLGVGRLRACVSISSVIGCYFWTSDGCCGTVSLSGTADRGGSLDSDSALSLLAPLRLLRFPLLTHYAFGRSDDGNGIAGLLASVLRVGFVLGLSITRSAYSPAVLGHRRPRYCSRGRCALAADRYSLHALFPPFPLRGDDLGALWDIKRVLRSSLLVVFRPVRFTQSFPRFHSATTTGGRTQTQTPAAMTRLSLLALPIEASPACIALAAHPDGVGVNVTRASGGGASTRLCQCYDGSDACWNPARRCRLTPLLSCVRFIYSSTPQRRRPGRLQGIVSAGDADGR